MRLFSTLALIIIAVFTIGAQEIIPLSSNPFVKHQSIQNIKLRTAQREAQFGHNYSVVTRGPQELCPMPVSGVIYLLNGDTLVNYLKETNFDSLKFDLSFDSGELLVDTITYIDTTVFKYSLTNLPQGAFTDTLTVTVFSDSTSFPLQYIITNIRKGTNSIAAPTNLDTEQDLFFSIDTMALVGALSCFYVDCYDPILGTVNANNNSFIYSSNRFAGEDTICYIMCDEFTICDTIRFPINIERPSINLPFFDDFSYAGPYPQPDFWLDDRVFVNRTMSAAPPSLGVATFDGLNEGGTPYGSSFGKTDVLSSAYINLFANTTLDNIFLSFYIEPKGLGFYPSNNQGDKVILQFRNQAKDWIDIDTIKGLGYIPDDSIPPFIFKSYPINDPQYFYNAFQFRFVAYGNQSGIWDTWHLDYVRLAANSQADAAFDDIAFSTEPKSILKQYTSMPWRHFKSIEEAVLRDDTNADIYNHFGTTASITNSGVSIEEPNIGYAPTTPYVLATGNIEPNLQHFDKNINDFGGYLSSFQVANPTPSDYLAFETQYFLVNNSQANYAGVMRNDTAKHTTIFSDYFAYDDGTAEGAIRANGSGTQIAVKYHTTVADTLKAIQFHFPHLYNYSNNQLFNLRVWVDSLDDTPDFESVLRKPIYPDFYRDTLVAFTTYLLTDDLNTDTLLPLFVPAGKDFYIGWQQVSSEQYGLPVGLDLNNKEGNEFIYKNQLSGWSQTGNTIKGSVMIRPVFGNIKDSQSLGTDNYTNDKLQTLTFYPNPVRNNVFVKTNQQGDYLEDYQYEIFALDGSLISSGVLAENIDLQNCSAGVYFIKTLKKSNHSVNTTRLIIVK